MTVAVVEPSRRPVATAVRRGASRAVKPDLARIGSETPHSSVTASSVNEPPLERDGTAPSVIAVRAFSRIFAVSSRSLLQIHTRRGPFTLGAACPDRRRDGAIEPFTGLAINRIGVQIPAILHTKPQVNDLRSPQDPKPEPSRILSRRYTASPASR